MIIVTWDYRAKVATVLRKLGVPEVSMKHLPLPSATLTELLKKHLALPSKPENVADVIGFMLKMGGEIGKLSLLDCETLLQYFQERCEAFSEESLQTIKMLPIFRLPSNSLTDLLRFQHHHTIEGYKLLTVEAETWMEHVNCVFLQPCRLLTLIYDQLGISPITHADIYLKYILPSFHLLSLEARLVHLKCIKDTVLYHASQENQAILERLSHIPFIPDGTNTLQTASCFFDPDNQVFKAMVDPNKLLPTAFRLLTYFLSRIGLQTVVTQELFFKFAKEVETRANGVTNNNQLKKLFEISELLTKELYHENLHDPTFLQKIAKIKFIPSVPIQQELIDIHPAFSSSDSQDYYRVPFIAYRGSIPAQYLELVWSVAMLLPHWAIPSNVQIKKDVKMHDCLGIENRAIIDKALSHIQNVCVCMEEKNAIHKEDTLSPKVREKFKHVMQKILKYLTDNISKHGDLFKRRLQHIPICLVAEGHVLIRADQLVFDMTTHDEKSLWPYLYKAPRHLAVFDEILKLLGAQDYFAFDQLAGVLSAIQRECGDQRLGPNESEKARSAVSQLFRLLDIEEKKCKISVSELYLLSSDNFMRKASHLHYADPYQMDQMKLVSTDKEFIIPLKQCGFDVKDEIRLIELLPEHLRPKNLGSEMHESLCDSNEDCPAGKYCPYLEHIKRMLNSEEMTRVLLRLVQHQLENGRPTAENEKSIRGLQRFSNFGCKTELKLGVYDSEGNMLAERSHSRAALFDKSTRTIYLQHSWPLKELTSVIFKQIADCCNALIGGLLDGEHKSHLLSALDSQSPDDMNEILSKLNIPEYDTTTHTSQPDRHRPGSIVPRDIRHLLDQDPYNLFRENEIVGYERLIDDIDSEPQSNAECTENNLCNYYQTNGQE